ncbi:hypothetical protein [Agrobacterium tumefaciens]|uniref:hypothetical protein n=1 Tax=Agrobacterium tumefaciens TaxID=358 RepID=UPI003BA12AC4
MDRQKAAMVLINLCGLQLNSAASLIVLSGSVCAANEVQANPADEGLSESGRAAPLRHAKLQKME